MAQKPECPHVGAPMWMVTYSDMVTLLLTFFVLLLSMANMDPIRFLQVQNSIEQAFGVRQGQTRPSPYIIPIIPTQPKGTPASIPMEIFQRYHKKMKSDLELAKLDGQIEASLTDNDSIVLRIQDSVLFEPGSTTLNSESYPVLRKIADIIRPLPLSLRIEGHSDNTPVSSPTTSNWDISTARAVAVMAFYNRGMLLPQDRMAAAGYGDTRPLAPNISEENRSKNRRVDFILRSNRPVREERRGTPTLPF